MTAAAEREAGAQAYRLTDATGRCGTIPVSDVPAVLAAFKRGWLPGHGGDEVLYGCVVVWRHGLMEVLTMDGEDVAFDDALEEALRSAWGQP